MFREPFDLDAPHPHLLRLGAGERGPYVLPRRFGVPSYDFDFEARLECRHPVFLPDEVRCIARLGAIADYPDVYARLRAVGLRLVNSPEQSRLANDLAAWAPLLGPLTPRSLVFEAEVDVPRVEAELGYPLFVKTVQQTLAHRRDVAFVDDRAGLLRSVAAYRADPVLGRQALAIRERVRLRLLPADAERARVPAAFELRVFLLDGSIVGLGPYWSKAGSLSLSADQEERVQALALEVFARLQVPFLAVDLALHEDGHFLVVETNDGQESGYTGIEPEAMWRRVIELATDAVQAGV